MEGALLVETRVFLAAILSKPILYTNEHTSICYLNNAPTDYRQKLHKKKKEAQFFVFLLS